MDNTKALGAAEELLDELREECLAIGNDDDAILLTEPSLRAIRETLDKATADLRAQLAERDAQLAVLRMSIEQMEAKNATRQPNKESEDDV